MDLSSQRRTPPPLNKIHEKISRMRSLMVGEIQTKNTEGERSRCEEVVFAMLPSLRQVPLYIHLATIFIDWVLFVKYLVSFNWFIYII